MTSQTVQHGNGTSLSSPVPFFGPNFGRNLSSLNGDASEDEAASKSRSSPRTRKHGRENTANGLGLELSTTGPAAKRSRRSNGTEITTTTTTTTTTSNDGNNVINNNRRGSDSMEIDQNGYSRPDAPERRSTSNSPAADGHSAMIGGLTEGARNGMDVDVDVDVDGDGDGDEDGDDDDAPAPEHASSTLTRTRTRTLTNGESVGVQSDKVRELGPETSLLCVPDKNVMHTAWNPRDPQILATGGEALCRIWTISSTKTAVHTNDDITMDSSDDIRPEQQQQHRYVDTLDPSDNSLVTTMAWSPDGDILAVATRSDTSDWIGAVSLWDKNGKSLDELPTAQDMVLMFRWNPSGTYLLGITSSGRGSSALVIWDTRSSDAMPPFQLDDVVTDAAWSDDQKFTICGQNIIVNMALDIQGIITVHSHDEQEKYQNWTHIRFDPTSRTTAVAAEESAILGIMDASGTLKTTTAHDAEITALAYQPVSNPALHLPGNPRLLATSSLDGHIRIWDANQPFTTIHTLNLGRNTPPMAISFTPDGYLVAAASWHRVLIWNADVGGLPKASWKGEPGKWQSLVVNGVDQDSGIGDEEEGPTHSLSWDVDGGKLAYGLGSQVCQLCTSISHA